jgi:hypothetical protein
MSKAFDRVWHDDLAWKLQNHRFPVRMQAISKDFLTDRTFHIS